MNYPNCPQCGKELMPVVQSENSMLNSEQFDAIRAGDYYCKYCKGNERGKFENLCYWWENEVTPTHKHIKSEDTPLSITIKNDCLIIQIGIGTLAFAFEHSEQNNPFDDDLNEFKRTYKIANKMEFAKDVLRELCDEAENGETIFTRLLDKACLSAVYNGSIGVEDPDEVS
jgi:hypothetical protein